MRSVTKAHKKGLGLTWARRPSSTSLPASLRADYRRFVTDFPLGFAVLHLEDPQDAKTWSVVAANTLAALVVGSTTADILAIRTLEKPRQSNGQDMAELIRATAAGKSKQLLCHIRKGKAGPSMRTYALGAFHMAGNCVGLLLQDETVLRNTVRDLLEARQHTRLVCESVRAILWRADPETLEFRHVTKEAEDILGYWMERWYKESNFWKNRVHPDDWETVRHTCDQVARDGMPRQFECRMTAADATLRWFRVLAHRLVSPKNSVEIAGAMVEITGRKRLEETARNLSARMLLLRRTERSRIIHELHAGITQYLTALQLNLRILQNADSRPIGKGHPGIENSLGLLTMCLAESRNLSYTTHSPLIETLGFAVALESFLESFALRSGFAWHLDITKNAHEISPEAELVLFRAAQECLSMVYRHVRAGLVALRLTTDEENVVLLIEDDGVGPSPEILEAVESDSIDALGIRATKRRIHELGGQLEIFPSGTGTRVRASLPKTVALTPGLS